MSNKSADLFSPNLDRGQSKTNNKLNIVFTDLISRVFCCSLYSCLIICEKEEEVTLANEFGSSSEAALI